MLHAACVGRRGRLAERSPAPSIAAAAHGHGALQRPSGEPRGRARRGAIGVGHVGAQRCDSARRGRIPRPRAATGGPNRGSVLAGARSPAQRSQCCRRCCESCSELRPPARHSLVDPCTPACSRAHCSVRAVHDTRTMSLAFQVELRERHGVSFPQVDDLREAVPRLPSTSREAASPSRG